MHEPETMTLVLASHVRSLRWKTHRHAAVAFHLAAISEAVETIAILADLDLPPAERLAEWTRTLGRNATGLESAVNVLTHRKPLQ